MGQYSSILLSLCFLDRIRPDESLEALPDLKDDCMAIFGIGQMRSFYISHGRYTRADTMWRGPQHYAVQLGFITPGVTRMH